MPRAVALQPLELAPEWLTESPITADDLRAISPASTLFRMSFGAASQTRHRERNSTTDNDTNSFLCHGEDSDDEDDDSGTVEEPQAMAEPSLPSTVPCTSECSSRPATPSTAPTRPDEAPSATSARPAARSAFDTRSPWFMQIDPGCLSALDDQLLQYPSDAFADLCYARAVRSNDASSARATPVPGGYSWRRLSRLLSACPDLSHAALDFAADVGSVPTARGEPAAAQERESESESDDTDSEQLASPEQSAPVWTCSVYQPGVEHQHAESPYRPYASQPLISKPLPALPSHRFTPSPPHSPPPCSPPPLFMPPPAVAQAQLAFLFLRNAPPRPDDSVHFSPGLPHDARHGGSGGNGNGAKGKGRTRRGTLRVNTSAGHGIGSAPSAQSAGASPWSPRPSLLQRGLAGIGLRAGLSH